jgi:hypothetical protein
MRPGLPFRVSLGLALFLGPSAFASHVNCPATNTTLSTYATPADGCVSANIQFSGFTLTNPSGETIVGDAGVNYLLPATTSTLTGANIFINSTTPGGLGFDAVDPVGGCDSNSGNAGFCIQGSNQALVQSITYTMTAASETIDFINFTGTIVSHSSGGGGAAAIVFRQICLGTATFTSNCGGLITLQGDTLVGGFQTLNFNLTANFSPQTVLAVRDTVFLSTKNATGSFAEVVGIDLVSAPEPATYLTFGSLLLGLGLARFRKKT